MIMDAALYDKPALTSTFVKSKLVYATVRTVVSS